MCRENNQKKTEVNKKKKITKWFKIETNKKKLYKYNGVISPTIYKLIKERQRKVFEINLQNKKGP